MSIKKRFLTTYCILSIATLTGCGTSTTSQRLPTASTPLNQICENLKQELVQNASNEAFNISGNYPIQEVRLYKAYERYHCEPALQSTKKP